MPINGWHTGEGKGETTGRVLPRPDGDVMHADDLRPSYTWASALLAQEDGALAACGLWYVASLDPADRRDLVPGALADALGYLATAALVYDLSDPDEAFEAYAYLTERIALPEAHALIDLALSYGS